MISSFGRPDSCLADQSVTADDASDVVRVFVVDDHVSYQRAIASVIVLTPGTLLVGVASSVREAVELVPATGADLAVVDIQLGDGSGIELARRFSTTIPEMCVLLISTLAEHDLPADLATCDCVGFIRKDRFGPAALTAVCAAEGLLAAE